jgi:integrase
MGELVQLQIKDNIIKDWLNQYKSKETKRGYKYAVEDFFGCDINYINEWKIKGIKFRDVQKYIKGLLDSKSDNTVETRKAALSSFFEYCIDEGIISENVWCDRRIKRLIKLNATKGEEAGKSISKEDIRELLDRINNRYEKLMIGIMFRTGVRVSELVNIEYSDIEKVNELYWLKVIGKGSRLRYIPIKEELIREIEEYMRTYKVENKLFNIGTRQVDVILKKWIELSCHDCRRSFAINYVNSRGLITDLQVILGHSNINTTRKYVIEYEKFNGRMGSVIDW